MPASPLRSRTPAWRWAALLGFALLAPATLPAGGGERRLPEVRRRESRREPLVISSCHSLRCAPRCEAPVLARLESGVPLRVLREWLAPNGNRWVQVETTAAAGGARRGWLAG
jgi:hypothetical protein